MDKINKTHPERHVLNMQKAGNLAELHLNICTSCYPPTSEPRLTEKEED